MTVELVLRRLAGLLLLWAIAPLPFAGVAMAPFWVAAGVAASVRAAWPRRRLEVGTGALNLAAIGIIVAVAAAGGLAVGPLRPLGHLLLLLSAVQVVTVDDRRSFVRALPGIGLVWLVGVSSSTHVAVAPYFAASAVVAWWAGMRIHLVVLADEAGTTVPRAPSFGHAVAGATAAMALAVPVFVAMPRLASPWVSGYGAHAVTGFASSVNLGGTGPIQESRELAVVVTMPAAAEPPAAWSRLRGTALDPVARGAWAPRRVEFERVLDAGERVDLADGGSLEGATRLELEVLEPRRYLFLPGGTVALEAPLPVTLDEAGSVVLAVRPDGPVTYAVWSTGEPTARFDPPVARETRLDDPDPRVAALARRIAGDIDEPAERAAAVERFLRERFEYSLRRGGGFRQDPVSWFLLDGREGHCEYFAAGMVVLLRHLDVPARIVSGYSGGEVAPGGRQILVREANAHTWVEAWAGERRGWVAFDPTPADGVPRLSMRTGIQRLLWAWDWVSLTWDRYVLTFGLGEQVELVAASADAVAAAAARIRWWHPVIGVVAFAAAAGVRRWLRSADRRRPRRGPAASAVERLHRRLTGSGVPVPAGATVRWIGRAAARRWPEAQGSIGRLVTLAERELYAATPPAGDERAAARQEWLRFRRTAPR